MKKILIVPGHFFKEPGTINEKLGITEYKFCLQTALELFKNEEWDDIDVILKSRNKEYSELPEEINSLAPDLILELHLNAFDGETQGTEVLHYINSSKSKKIAGVVQKYLVEELKYRDRGLKPISARENGYPILRYTNAPCIIVESFFLDSIETTRELLDNLHKISVALKKAIREIVDGVL